jgi:hypothetical protein
VVQHLTESQSDSHAVQDGRILEHYVLYFFFRKSHVDSEGNALAAIGTLISQLVHCKPSLYTLLLRQYEFLAMKGNVTWSWQSLWNVFLELLHGIQKRSCVYIVLDALDECTSNSRGVLLDSFTELVNNSRPSGMLVKLFITSRPGDEALNLSCLYQHFEITTRDTADDMQAFISSRVEQLAKRKSLAPNVKHAIANFLERNAEGMFLWVVLVMNELERRGERLTDEVIASKLAKVPMTLVTIYTAILDALPYSRQVDLWRILRWLLYSRDVLG